MTDETYDIEIHKFFEASEKKGLKYPVQFEASEIEIPQIDFNISEYKQKQEVKILEYKKTKENLDKESLW